MPGKEEPEASVSSTNPNDPFTAEMTNENRSPLRASRTTIFPRAGTHVASTVAMLIDALARDSAITHDERKLFIVVQALATGRDLKRAQPNWVSTPAIVAVMNVARDPPRTARIPKRAMSPRRSGASPPMPPI